VLACALSTRATARLVEGRPPMVAQVDRR
jgi:hypothetical protein